MWKWCWTLVTSRAVIVAVVGIYVCTLHILPAVHASDDLEVMDSLEASTEDESVLAHVEDTHSITQTESLPIVDHSLSLNLTNKLRLILVSTLDGRLSALDAASGTPLWQLTTGPGPLLSSSISQIEVKNQRDSFRLIPSLDGELYRWDGEMIEAVGVTVTDLLQPATFLEPGHVNSVVAGGKEVRSYGVDPLSGTQFYECSMTGCDTKSATPDPKAPVLLVKRHTQTVRAVESKTGLERWNYSVGHHEVVLLAADAEDVIESCDGLSIQNDIVFVVPEGVIALKGENGMRWKERLASPIVQAWTLLGRELMPLDIFQNNAKNNEYNPMLYIGLHGQQLYAQPSASKTSQELKGENFRLPWAKPNLRPSLYEIENVEDTSDPSSDDSKALVLWNQQKGRDLGLLLYDTSRVSSVAPASPELEDDVKVEDYDEKVEEEIGTAPNWPPEFQDEEATVVQFVFVSLWFWWREVLMISVFTAVLSHILIAPQYVRHFHLALSREVTRHVNAILPVLTATVADFERQRLHQQFNQEMQRRRTTTENQDSNSAAAPLEMVVALPPGESNGSSTLETVSIQREVSSQNVQDWSNFRSRYLEDFLHIQCLGKGGFGVVFEAKNKFDDCNYAVKRIRLPNNRESREKVMREVKALAKLEHKHIVRYFQSWQEEPPPGWQEHFDQQWKANCDMSMSFAVGSNAASSSAVFCNTSVTQACSSSLPSPHLDESSSFDVVFERDSESQDQGTTESGSRIHSVISESVVSCSRTSEISNSRQIVPVAKSPVPQRSPCAYVYIQMQLCQKESLTEWLQSHNDDRDPFEVLRMFDQIVSAVEYVHRQGLMHRDLKPSNIFFAPDGSIKVGDFGLVTTLVQEEEMVGVDKEEERFPGQGHTNAVGTKLYMSPEQLKGSVYDHKVDIYSLGLIFFEMLVPFSTQMERRIVLQKVRVQKYPAGFKEKYANEHALLGKMLSNDPEERPTASDIRERAPLVSLKSSPKDLDSYMDCGLGFSHNRTRTISSSDR